MKYDNFIKSLKNNSPPSDISAPIKSMWYAKKGDWDMAHKIAQDIKTVLGSWIHAYLHRIEGDESNADYWYKKANVNQINANLDDEANQIIKHILDLNIQDLKNEKENI